MDSERFFGTFATFADDFAATVARLDRRDEERAHQLRVDEARAAQANARRARAHTHHGGPTTVATIVVRGQAGRSAEALLAIASASASAVVASGGGSGGDGGGGGSRDSGGGSGMRAADDAQTPLAMLAQTPSMRARAATTGGPMLSGGAFVRQPPARTRAEGDGADDSAPDACDEPAGTMKSFPVIAAAASDAVAEVSAEADAVAATTTASMAPVVALESGRGGEVAGVREAMEATEAAAVGDAPSIGTRTIRGSAVRGGGGGGDLGVALEGLLRGAVTKGGGGDGTGATAGQGDDVAGSGGEAGRSLPAKLPLLPPPPPSPPPPPPSPPPMPLPPSTSPELVPCRWDGTGALGLGDALGGDVSAARSRELAALFGEDETLPPSGEVGSARPCVCAAPIGPARLAQPSASASASPHHVLRNGGVPLLAACPEASETKASNAENDAAAAVAAAAAADDNDNADDPAASAALTALAADGSRVRSPSLLLAAGHEVKVWRAAIDKDVVASPPKPKPKPKARHHTTNTSALGHSRRAGVVASSPDAPQVRSVVAASWVRDLRTTGFRG